MTSEQFSLNSLLQTKEEMKVAWESRKIMDAPDLKVSCTCVRIPTLRAHSEAITIETELPITANEVLTVGCLRISKFQVEFGPIELFLAQLLKTFSPKYFKFSNAQTPYCIMIIIVFRLSLVLYLS